MLGASRVHDFQRAGRIERVRRALRSRRIGLLRLMFLCKT